ncbi:MAG TPA: hypothetical protein VJN93_13315 [Candidatus Acidoferrum sp.]|nr:hypothetical protein [Candidatus Acidoferrum sp.]
MSSITIGIIVAVVVLLVVGVGLWRAGREYLKFRGKRIVSCPETHEAAGVRVAAGSAAVKAIVGREELHLKECSRWPEREDCGQGCLAQIEEAPNACLVTTIVTRWYQGKECAYCHKPFGDVKWDTHKPALVSAEGKTVQWNEVPVDKLQETMKTHLPVCWDCHVAETFRRVHPELVVDRAEEPLRMSVYK